jgi:predicted nuclease with RNAse H fold
LADELVAIVAFDAPLRYAAERGARQSVLTAV